MVINSLVPCTLCWPPTNCGCWML